MLPASPVVPTYCCPDESYEIPHPVHLARLAAGYARCRACRHRDGRTPGATDTEVEAVAASSPPSAANGARSCFTEDGVRGVYLNELTRIEAGKIAGAFASCLWEDLDPDEFTSEGTVLNPESAGEPSAGEPTSSGEGIVVLASGRPGPTVVLAHDERPASPDLVMGVGAALRRMGCQVIDVGGATRPAFWFAVDHLHAAGGIHVTGSGCDAAWTGLDFVRQGVRPCSRRSGLEQIESRYRQGFGRPSRRPGAQRLFSAAGAYEAGLWKHFHALRPLRIAIGCPNRILSELLTRLFRKSACRLLPVPIPTRARNFDDRRDPDLIRVASAVRGDEAHLGILIDDDAQRCALFDNAGARVPTERIMPLLAEGELEARPNGRVVWQAGRNCSIPPRLEPEPRFSAAPLAAVSQALREPDAVCGADAAGRFWFVESYPVCDAVLTLVKLLHILSRSDTPFADLVRAPACPQTRT